MNADLERVWAKGGTTPYDPRFRVTDGGSRLGFLGSIALSPLTRGVWQIEGSLNGFEQGGVNDQGVSAVIVSRNTFVGIEDDRFGRLILGNNDNAYRSLLGSGGDTGGNLGLTKLGLDLWNNTSAQLTGGTNNIFSRGEARYQNSVHYLSPAWPLLSRVSHIQAAGSYSFDETLANGRHRDRFSLAVLYQLEGLRVGAALDYQRNTGINVDNLQQGLGLQTDAVDGPATYYYKALASYLFPTHTYVGAAFERSNFGYVRFNPPTSSNFYASLSNGTLHQSGVMASIAQGIGPATLMASGGGLFSLDHTLYGRRSDSQAIQLSFGVKYDFNDTFGAYGFFTSIRNKAQQDINLGVPVYSNNLGTSRASLALGDSPNAFGLGVIARF